MTAAILRGSRAFGYRTSEPLECPHCHKPVEMAGTAGIDKQGLHLALWAIEPSPGEYTPAELRHVMHGPPQDALVTGVALPQEPGRGEFRDDPIPTFDGSDET